MSGLTNCNWSRQPGTYVLVMWLSGPCSLEIGRLGTFAFRPGRYAYVGSALGPGGLGARLERHARREKWPHWHIDYLLDRAVLCEVWYLKTATRWECAWAGVLGKLPEVQAPVPGFGASDCACRSHLFFARDVSHLMPFLRNATSLCGTQIERTVLYPV